MYLDYLIEISQNKRICIFPMGIAGKSLLDKLASIGIAVDYFCDNDDRKKGEEYKGIKCISKEELKRINEKTVIIIESLYYHEIKKGLINEGFQNVQRLYFEKIAGEEYINNNRMEYREKREEVMKLLSDEKSQKIYDHLLSAYEKEALTDDYFETVHEKEQYFPSDIIKLSNEECFVDLGAYTGDSAEAFIKHVGGFFEKMHLFELDPTIYKRLMLNVPLLYEKTKKGIIQCYPFGASDFSGEVVISEGDSSSSMVCPVNKNNSENVVKGMVKLLDNVLSDERVTFIKADIEGAELPALRGLKHVIENQKPTLAFCIYHSLSDMLNIPLWIKKTVSDYDIFVRHHTDLMLETVCYAIPKR